MRDDCQTRVVTSLQGLSILVIGASGGLGSAISGQLQAEGALLTLQGRDEAKLAALGSPHVTGDIRDSDTAQRAVDAAIAAYGQLDGVVIASGVVAFGMMSDLTDEVLADLFAINTIAPIRIVRAALPHLEASGKDGNNPFVVNLSAVVAEQPTAGMAAYSASKAALTAFDTAAGRELRRSGIRLIDARPPHTETGLADRPLAGAAPRLPQGLEPSAVTARIIEAIKQDERDLPSTAFTA